MLTPSRLIELSGYQPDVQKTQKRANDLTLPLANDFPCNDVNKEKIRQAARNRFQKKDCSTEAEWVQILFAIRSLIFLVGWTDEQAWKLFDEICQWEEMGNYDEEKNRVRWDKDDFKYDGITYKSLLADLTKHDAEPDVLVEFPNKDQATTKTKIFQMLTVRDLLRLKAMSWLVKGLLPAEGIGALFGPSGSGKSFLIIDLLMHLCLGRDWFGYKIHKKHTVLYLALEGGAGVRNRVAAYLQHNNIKEPDNFFTIIDNFDIRQQFWDLIEAVKEIEPSVIIIDTLNQSAAGCDENSNVDMSLIVSRAKIIADAIKGLVLLVHHTGKDASRGLRGHSSLNAALDVAIEVQAETVKTPRFFKITKSKDGACGDGLAFKLKSIDLAVDADGDAITSCVVERDISGLFAIQIPIGKNVITAWDLLKNQLPISYMEAKNKVKDALVQENPSRKRPDNTAKDAIDSLHQQGFIAFKDNYWVKA
jgi:archaellum biogenesis ATPase FlaH